MQSLRRVWLIAVCMSLTGMAVPLNVCAQTGAEGKATPRPKRVDKAIHDLKSQNVKIRRRAAKSLRSARTLDAAAMAVLIGAFEDPDAKVRVAVVM